MSLVIDGQLKTEWLEHEREAGEFVRLESQFRHWITPDGRPGPSGEGGFVAERDRYHLYVSLACPWAHRTLIFRKLKGLEKMISVSVVNPYMGEEGWHFAPYHGSTADDINQAQYLYENYLLADPHYTGIVTVPVLWDKQQKTIVNNESSEIIRMFNSAFDHLGAKPEDYYPDALRVQIDEVNQLVYNNINNGVYRAGFASEQQAYKKAYHRLFSTLDQLEERLTHQPYLAGETLSEADWRLFTTLVRFDTVYYSHFKCNRQRLVDYPNLWRFTRHLYQIEGIADTVNMDHIKHHYYGSHKELNPTGIIPCGPEIDFTANHE